MSAKIKLREVNVGSTFPATWEGVFTQQPITGEVEAKKAKIQKLMNDDKRKQVRNGNCSPGFKLVFEWKRTSDSPVRYKLIITLDRDHRHGRDGGGQETPPRPKTPPPPAQ